MYLFTRIATSSAFLLLGSSCRAFVPVSLNHNGEAVASCPYANTVATANTGTSSRINSCLTISMSAAEMPRVGFSSSQKKSPMKFLRIKPKRSRNNKQRVFELQTAVATLGKKNQDGTDVTIDLHAQLHFGEDGYFQFYNDEAFVNNYDKVFYELIVSNSLLHTENDGTKRLISLQKDGLNRGDTGTSDYINNSNSNPNPVAPPPSDESTASSYGLACQLNVIDYTKENWIHCDATREEYLSFSSSSSSTDITTSDPLRPLWALSSTAMTPIQEYTSALFRPFTPSSVQSANSNISQFSSLRLFSNLFLPGENLASIIRIFSWVLSPSPEVNILLLDWSSIINPRPTGMISPIFLPSIQSLLTGNILNARKLIFAQVVVSGQTAGGQDLNIVRRRNSVALDTLLKTIENTTSNSKSDSDKITNSNNNAVLYGAMHCQDLLSRLEKMGYSLRKVEWRKAWSVNVPTFGTGENLSSTMTKTPGRSSATSSIMSDFVSANDLSDIAFGLVIVPLYLLIGGLDWLATVKDIATSVDDSLWTEAGATSVFYVIRHLVLYVALSKFVVEWDGEAKLFGDTTQ